MDRQTATWRDEKKRRSLYALNDTVNSVELWNWLSERGPLFLFEQLRRFSKRKKK